MDNLGITLLVLVIGALYFLLRKKKPRNYPPSPGWGLPILGHMSKLGSRPFKVLMDWKATLGPVVSVDFGSFPTVAISDYKLIKEALTDWRFSGRPELSMLKDRSGGARHGLLFSDGDEWVEIRRFTLRHLRDFGFGRKSMESILHVESLALNEQLKQANGSPLVFRSFLNTAVINSLWTIIASQRFEHNEPQLSNLLNLLSTNIQENNMMASVSLFIPWLGKWFPQASGYHNFLKNLPLFIDFLQEPMKGHRATLVPGHPRDLMDVYIEETQNCTDPKSFFYGSVGERVMLTVFLDLFIAGAETTTTTMTFFGMYLAAYPDVQAKLYDEILRVIGKTRLPSLEDKPFMPYTEAVTMEVMRISSFLPIGLFHSTLADVELGGYFIPKDTMIITNLYSCHHDVEYWGDPEVFRPERFLTPDGQTVLRHEAAIPFSWGKRVCLGDNLAKTELFIFSTAVVQKFTFAFDPENTPKSLDSYPGMVLSAPAHKLIFTERT